jgi:hypothetical protein
MPQANTDITSLGSLREYTIEIEFTVWATAANGQGQTKVAELLDNLQATLEGATSTLDAAKIKFESFNASRIDKVEVNEQKLYTAGAIATFTTFAL